MYNFTIFKKYFRLYGHKCTGCGQGISPTELVRKSRDNKIFHIGCMTCFVCRRELSTGDQLYIVDDNKFMCKEDYVSSKYGQHPGLSGEFCYVFFFQIIDNELWLQWIFWTIPRWRTKYKQEELSVIEIMQGSKTRIWSIVKMLSFEDFRTWSNRF